MTQRKLPKFKQLVCRIIILSLLFDSFLLPSTFAESRGYEDGSDIKSASRSSEYIAGKSNAVLMRVNLWGGVRSPGIYHIPLNTDLISLISYAGGPTDRALLNQVTINRSQNLNTTSKLAVDVPKLLDGTSNNTPVLHANDIVIVPEKTAWIDNNTLNTVGFVATLLSILATGVLISVNLNR